MNTPDETCHKPATVHCEHLHPVAKQAASRAKTETSLGMMMNLWENLQEANLLSFLGRACRSTVVDAIFDDWFRCFLEER